METNRLKQFCVLCETSNLRAAAELLGLSHSALSKSMKVLQDELGLGLLQPEGRGIQITDQGKELYNRARLFLAAEEEFLRPRQGTTQVARLGTFEVFSTYLIPAVWEKYFLGQALELRELLPGRIEGMVASGDIDVGLTYEPIPTAGVDFLKVARMSLGLFARPGKKDLPFVAPITPVHSVPTGPKGLDGWPEDKYPREVKYRVDMLESGLSLARAGEAAIFMPVFLARLHNDVTAPGNRLVEYPTPFKKIQRTVYLVKRKSMPENDLVKKLGRLLRSELPDR